MGLIVLPVGSRDRAERPVVLSPTVIARLRFVNR
jgi:hypothetical protein